MNALAFIIKKKSQYFILKSVEMVTLENLCIYIRKKTFLQMGLKVTFCRSSLNLKWPGDMAVDLAVQKTK